MFQLGPFAVIGYDSVHLPRMDGGCVTCGGEETSCWAFAVFFLRPWMPSGDWLVCVAGEAGWIDGTAAGPTQL